MVLTNGKGGFGQGPHIMTKPNSGPHAAIPSLDPHANTPKERRQAQRSMPADSSSNTQPIDPLWDILDGRYDALVAGLFMLGVGYWWGCR